MQYFPSTLLLRMQTLSFSLAYIPSVFPVVLPFFVTNVDPSNVKSISSAILSSKGPKRNKNAHEKGSHYMSDTAVSKLLCYQICIHSYKRVILIRLNIS